jgi:conjugal transfer mating pair stabilization protein TraG
MKPQNNLFNYSFLFLMLFLFISPSAAFALDMEFYTYGGFDEVVASLNKMTLIFSTQTINHYTLLYQQ